MESKLKEIIAKWHSTDSTLVTKDQSDTIPAFHVENIKEDYVGYIEQRINDELEEGYRQQAETMSELYTGKVLKK